MIIECFFLNCNTSKHSSVIRSIVDKSNIAKCCAINCGASSSDQPTWCHTNTASHNINFIDLCTIAACGDQNVFTDSALYCTNGNIGIYKCNFSKNVNKQFVQALKVDFANSLDIVYTNIDTHVSDSKYLIQLISNCDYFMQHTNVFNNSVRKQGGV